VRQGYPLCIMKTCGGGTFQGIEEAKVVDK
jgi:hypothetical protein